MRCFALGAHALEDRVQRRVECAVDKGRQPVLGRPLLLIYFSCTFPIQQVEGLAYRSYSGDETHLKVQ